jgi:membrane fusion protein, multidrug efflux system
MLSTGTPIVTVVSLSPMVIEATASERDIARIRSGTAVNVTVDSLPGQQFAGRVLRISPLLDPQTRNGIVEIEIPNRGHLLKGEMFARIQLDLGSKREAALLPRDALVYRGDQPGVYMIENDIAKFRPVETGLTQEDKVEVLSGLQVGEVVVTRGSNLIKEGDRVRAMGAGGAGGPGKRPEAAAQQTSEQAPKPAETTEKKPNKPAS